MTLFEGKSALDTNPLPKSLFLSNFEDKALFLGEWLQVVKHLLGSLEPRGNFVYVQLFGLNLVVDRELILLIL